MSKNNKDNITTKRTEAVDNLLSVMENFTPEQITEIIASRQADLRKQKEEQEQKEHAAADLREAVERYAKLANIKLNIDWNYFFDYIENNTIVVKPGAKISDYDSFDWFWRL